MVVAPTPEPKAAPKPRSKRTIYDPALGRQVQAPVYWRFDMKPGAAIKGPAIIAEDETSTRLKIKQRGFFHDKAPGFHDLKAKMQAADKANPETPHVVKSAEAAADALALYGLRRKAAGEDPLVHLSRILKNTDFGYKKRPQSDARGSALSMFNSVGGPNDVTDLW